MEIPQPLQAPLPLHLPCGGWKFPCCSCDKCLLFFGCTSDKSLAPSSSHLSPLSPKRKQKVLESIQTKSVIKTAQEVTSGLQLSGIEGFPSAKDISRRQSSGTISCQLQPASFKDTHVFPFASHTTDCSYSSSFATFPCKFPCTFLLFLSLPSQGKGEMYNHCDW